MSRRSALSDIEQEQLCVIPNSRRDMERLYPFSEPDLSLIRQRRRAVNRLGFAVQICFAYTVDQPAHGQHRTSNELRKAGAFVI